MTTRNLAVVTTEIGQWSAAERHEVSTTEVTAAGESIVEAALRPPEAVERTLEIGM